MAGISYQMLEVLAFCNRERAQPPSITITVLTFLVKKANEEFQGVYFLAIREKNLKQISYLWSFLSWNLKVSNVWRFGFFELLVFEPLRWLPRVFTNNPSYLAYVTERDLVTLSLRFCSQDSPLSLPI